jgi:hypothetical protein
MWFLVTWLGLTLVLAATQLQLVVTIYIERNQHDAYNGNTTIVLTDSLDNDIHASADVTSESQLASETVGVMLLIAYSTGAIAVWLVAAAWAVRDKLGTPVLQVLLAGYVAFVFVGMLPTAPPAADGMGPRRDFNPFLVWRVDAAVSQGLHVAAAVAYMFLPTLGKLWLLWRKPMRRAFAAFVALLLLSLAFVGTQVASLYETGDNLSGVWVVLEFVEFGVMWLAYSQFHLYFLYYDNSHAKGKSYARLPKT